MLNRIKKVFAKRQAEDAELEEVEEAVVSEEEEPQTSNVELPRIEIFENKWQLGVVTWFNVERNFGFIFCPVLNRDVFVHPAKVLLRDVFESVMSVLRVGNQVEFQLTVTSKGVEARNVRLIRNNSSNVPPRFRRAQCTVVRRSPSVPALRQPLPPGIGSRMRVVTVIHPQRPTAPPPHSFSQSNLMDCAAKEPPSMLSKAAEALSCKICLQVATPPLLMCQACCQIIGCEQCVLAISRACPLCRASWQTAKPLTQLRGLDDLLRGLKLQESRNTGT